MRLRKRLTYANVTATIAVFLALGGSSYAALRITGKQVVNHSLTGRDLKNGTLTSRQVKDRSLLSKDFKAGQLPAGPRGPQGVQGPRGAAGATGPAGPTFGVTTNATASTVSGCGPSTLATKTVTVTRPSRLLAAAGGAWDRGATNLHTGTLTVHLLKGSDVVATSPEGFASDFDNASAHRIGMSVTAVLFAGNVPFPTTETAYVAQPGTYTLRLDGGASDGLCTGSSTFWRTYLTYVLLGTAP